MSSPLDMTRIRPLQQALEQHPVYAAVAGMPELRLFMAQHVFPVWDFMSLVKALQHILAPAGAPWLPVGNPAVRRFINEIVLEEETDQGLPDAEGKPTFISHFELYCQAMREVGADPGVVEAFVAEVRARGVAAALRMPAIPAAAARFTATTFRFIDSGKPHVVAAAMALGRESIIPGMFRALLSDMAVAEAEAPAFHYYLMRHIHLDEGTHGPLALLMLSELCGGDPVRLAEAEQAAVEALEARLAFWDGVLASLAPTEQSRLRATGT